MLLIFVPLLPSLGADCIADKTAFLQYGIVVVM